MSKKKKGEIVLSDEEKEKRYKALFTQYNVWEEKIDKNGIPRKYNINLPNLGDLIYYEFNRYFITIIDSREIYYYNGGYYEPNGDAIIKNLSEQLLSEMTREHYKNEVLGYIRDKNYQKREVFNPPLNLINLKNGVYDIVTGELLPSSHEYHFINEIPVYYDADASSKDFEGFLQHICMQQGKRREIIEDTIQEYMGYSLYRSYFFKNYMTLDGGGDNAKTTLLDILLKLIGKRNNTGVSLQELNTRPFAKSKLFGKHTNISDDLPKKGLKYTGVIKQITGNSPIWADIKNHKTGIEFTNYAKPWYACNELPETEDITDAFFSRQLQITLLNKYLPRGSSEIDDETVFEADPDLIRRSTSPEQLSGIFNFAIIGLKRLLKQKHFSNIQTAEEKRQIWTRKTNPIHAFIEDEIETTHDDWVITVDDFFNEVVEYCAKNGFDKPTRHKVTTKMHNEGIRKQQKTVNGESRVWCWIGIRGTTNTEINHYSGPRKDGVIC
jgi:putative DNA primase/helicase